eukprot:c9278_g1_i1.p1 GENE.c9278_g1_i1~~c9278_g1_i1.p1  ORF type:complete len:352 (+),score=49.94 c9278_g1_i1:239-1294(+)
MTKCFHTCEAVKDGNDVNHVIAEYFQTCVFTNIEMASFLVGMSSLGFWICCQAPQFIKNYKSKSAEALSRWFLLEWFMGDFLNFIGAFLSGQQATQKFTAGLFLIMDTTMLSQYIYYQRYQAKIRQRSASFTTSQVDSSSESGTPRQRGHSFPSAVVIAAVAASSIPVAKAANEFLTSSSSDTPCALELSDIQVQIGWWFGWVSAFIYLNSRFPQILKNFRKKYAGGLSKAMFMCAFMGNLTYALGVIIRIRSWSEYKSALPWLVGSLGTLGLDMVIIMQVTYYKKNSQLHEPLLTSAPSYQSIGVNSEDLGRLEPRALAALTGPVGRVGRVHPVYLLPNQSKNLRRINSF